MIGDGIDASTQPVTVARRPNRCDRTMSSQRLAKHQRQHLVAKLDQRLGEALALVVA